MILKLSKALKLWLRKKQEAKSKYFAQIEAGNTIHKNLQIFVKAMTLEGN